MEENSTIGANEDHGRPDQVYGIILIGPEWGAVVWKQETAKGFYSKALKTSCNGHNSQGKRRCKEEEKGSKIRQVQ